MRRILGLVRLLFLLTLPTGASAQVTVEGRASTLTVGGRVHVQYSRSSVDGGGGLDAVDDLFFRRARLEVDARVSDLVDGTLEAEFADGPELRDAWVRLSLAPSFQLTFGQLKRAGTIFELHSGVDLPVIERDGRIEGLSHCPGVGGVCTFSRMTQALQLDDRDLGLRAEGRIGGRVAYMATLTNGQGRNTADVNDAKSAALRLSADLGGVRVGAFAASHDYLDEQGGTQRARALGADLEVGTFREGFHLIAGVVGGDNWLAPPDASFLAVQVLASRYVPLGGRPAGVEPLLRVSWTRPTAGESALLLTPGVLLYLDGRNALGVNLDLYDADDGPSEWSLKAQAFLYF